MVQLSKRLYLYRVWGISAELIIVSPVRVAVRVRGTYRGTRFFPSTQQALDKKEFIAFMDYLDGAEGIEPSNGGIKIRCLTAWLRPSADGSGPVKSGDRNRWDLPIAASLHARNTNTRGKLHHEGFCAAKEP